MGIALGSTEIADLKLGSTQVEKAYLGTNLVWQKVSPVTIKALKFSSAGAQTLGVNTSMLGTISPNFEYSLDDGTTWTAWTVSNPISFGNGTDLYVRGSNTMLATTGNNYTQFVFSTASPVACSGNIMHLFDYTQDLTAFPATAGGDDNDRGLKYMFKDCTVLTSAPELPATALAIYCYYCMFSGCTSLTTAPVLPATALVDHAYESMFQGCTALTTAPNLPAERASSSVYKCMFKDCTSLTTAPTISIVAGSQHCFMSMFQNCTALVNAPKILTATIAGGTQPYESMMSNMFDGCSSLESLPLNRMIGTGSWTFREMFKGCSKIKMSLTQEGDYQNAYNFLFMPASSSALDMFANTGGTFTGTPTQQTLYTSNTIIS